MFKVGRAYKHASYLDSFIVVLGVRSLHGSVSLDVGYWTQPKGWRPTNTLATSTIEVNEEEFSNWIPFIVGSDRCTYQRVTTLRHSNL